MLELSNKKICFNVVRLSVKCWFFVFDEELPTAFLEDCKLVTEIFVPQIVYVPQVFTNDRMLMFINALKLVSACIAHITCITQITFVFLNNALFLNKRCFGFCHFDLISNFPACKHWAQVAVNFLREIGELSSSFCHTNPFRKVPIKADFKHSKIYIVS